jgi:hypothetical protein
MNLECAKPGKFVLYSYLFNAATLFLLTISDYSFLRKLPDLQAWVKNPESQFDSLKFFWRIFCRNRLLNMGKTSLQAIFGAQNLFLASAKNLKVSN